LTVRPLKSNGEWGAKRKDSYALDDQSRAEEWRKGWADVCNKYLKGRLRVDHRSYARQGKKQLPTMHEGYVVRKIAKRGK